MLGLRLLRKGFNQIAFLFNEFLETKLWVLINYFNSTHKTSFVKANQPRMKHAIYWKQFDWQMY